LPRVGCWLNFQVKVVLPTVRDTVFHIPTRNCLSG
jgi:hypothetical protein